MIINLRAVLSTIVGATAQSAGPGVELRKGEYIAWCDLKGISRTELAVTLRQLADAVDMVIPAQVPAPVVVPRDDSQYEFSLEECKPEDINLGQAAPAPKRGRRKNGTH